MSVQGARDRSPPSANDFGTLSALKRLRGAQAALELVAARSRANAADLPETSRAGFRDDRLLIGILVSLILGAGYILWLDLRQLMDTVAEPWGPGIERTNPLPMTPPGDTDQVRPYLPRARPVLRTGRPDVTLVRLPGYIEPPGEAALSKRMVFKRGQDGAASAVGRIEPGTAGELERFLLAQGDELKTLVLHSPGGSVRDAIAMARMIRSADLETRVPENGYCASSCPLAFSGGIMRSAEPPVWIGGHQVATVRGEVGTLQQGIASAQDVSARCQQLLIDMGVDPKVWIFAMQTPHSQLHVFTRKQLEELKVVTESLPDRGGEGSEERRRS